MGAPGGRGKNPSYGKKRGFTKRREDYTKGTKNGLRAGRKKYLNKGKINKERETPSVEKFAVEMSFAQRGKKSCNIKERTEKRRKKLSVGRRGEVQEENMGGRRGGRVPRGEKKSGGRAWTRLGEGDEGGRVGGGACGYRRLILDACVGFQSPTKHINEDQKN